MALSLKHAFTSPKSDGTDATLVQPSNWNAEHTLTLGTAKLVGRTSSGTGTAEEISVGAGLTLSAGSLTGNVVTVAGRTGAVTLAVADVTGAAPLASPTFTGTVSGVTGTFTGALSGSTVADAVGTIRPSVLGTSQASTSGTAINFTDIPSWAKRITVTLNGVSTNGTSALLLQVGSTSYSTTGYNGQAWTATGGGVITSGLPLTTASAAGASVNSVAVLTLTGSNTWSLMALTGVANSSNNGYHAVGISPALSGALDRIRLTTANGTDTFDAGSVNILYE